jgi:hypothetical protein
MDSEAARKRLILELANVRAEQSARQQFLEKYNLDTEIADLSPAFYVDLAQSLFTRAPSASSLERLRQLLLPAGALDMLGIDWKRRRFSYQAHTRLQGAFYYLLQNSDLAKRCGNAACAKPYFFSKRRNARYCSDECFAAAQRAAKREWWEEHGEEWRQSRR